MVPLEGRRSRTRFSATAGGGIRGHRLPGAGRPCCRRPRKKMPPPERRGMVKLSEHKIGEGGSFCRWNYEQRLTFREHRCSSTCDRHVRERYGQPSQLATAPNPRTEASGLRMLTPNRPAKICSLGISGNVPMDMRIPPRKNKILLESNPLKSRILVRRLAVVEPLGEPPCTGVGPQTAKPRTCSSRALVFACGLVAAHLDSAKGVPRNGGRK